MMVLILWAVVTVTFVLAVVLPDVRWSKGGFSWADDTRCECCK